MKHKGLWEVTVLCSIIILALGHNDTDRNTMCTVCKCSSSFESNPYEVDCRNLKMDTLPEWDVYFQNDRLQVTNVHLYLDINLLTVVQHFGPMMVLTHISMSENRIRNLEPMPFEMLHNLRYLSLAYNNLTFLSADAFRSKEDHHVPIEILDLSHNHIHHLDDDIFQTLVSLVELRLSNNPLVTLDSSTTTALNSLRALSVLDLANTELTALPDELRNPIKHVDKLMLNGNDLTEVPKVLQHADQLLALNLDRNPIVRLDATSFEGLNSLRELNISHMPKLASIDRYAFGNMKSLTTLYCSENIMLEGVHPMAFLDKSGTPLTQLKMVEMRHNFLRYMDRMVFESVISLQSLDLQLNPFNCTCHMSWLKTQKIPEKFQKELRCDSPAQVSGERAVEVNFKLMPCPPVKKIQNQYVYVPPSPEYYNPYVGVIIGLAIICVLSVIGTVVFLKRKTIMSRLGPKPSVRYSKASFNSELDNDAPIEDSYRAW